jgi:hypothetical protein
MTPGLGRLCQHTVLLHAGFSGRRTIVRLRGGPLCFELCQDFLFDPRGELGIVPDAILAVALYEPTDRSVAQIDNSNPECQRKQDEELLPSHASHR